MTAAPVQRSVSPHPLTASLAPVTGSLLPYVGITVLFSLPAVPFLPLGVVAAVAMTALAAGLGGRGALEWGQRKGTEWVLAGFAVGTVLKAISLAMASVWAWLVAANIAASLLLNLGLLLLYSGWTSWRLAVSSGAGFTTHEPD